MRRYLKSRKNDILIIKISQIFNFYRRFVIKSFNYYLLSANSK